MEEKTIQVLRGVLLEANKDQDFGNGPVQFTRQALQGMADIWNAKQKRIPKGLIEIVLSMEGDKLMVESKVHYHQYPGLFTIEGQTKINRATLGADKNV